MDRVHGPIGSLDCLNLNLLTPAGPNLEDRLEWPWRWLLNKLQGIFGKPSANSISWCFLSRAQDKWYFLGRDNENVHFARCQAASASAAPAAIQVRRGKKIQLIQLRILEFLTFLSLVLVPVEVKEKNK